MSKRMSSGVRKPRPVDMTSYRMGNTIIVPNYLFDAYLAAARERRIEDERKWAYLVAAYSNTCRNEGDK